MAGYAPLTLLRTNRVKRRREDSKTSYANSMRAYTKLRDFPERRIVKFASSFEFSRIQCAILDTRNYSVRFLR